MQISYTFSGSGRLVTGKGNAYKFPQRKDIMSERKIINLSDLEMKVSRRGRKSTVTPEDIADAQALEIDAGWEVEEAHVNHADFADYFADAIRRDSTKTEADVINAWQSRFRQRAIALAKASGVEMSAVFSNDGGCYFIRKS